jgi:CheY-like chemotaxis protein
VTDPALAASVRRRILVADDNKDAAESLSMAARSRQDSIIT